MKGQYKRPLIWIAALLAVVLIVVLIVKAAKGSTEAVDPAQIEKGVAFLEAQEKKDPAVVDEILRQRRAEELAAQREELLQQLYSGEKDVWPMFEDYVLLGDSRAVGFYYFDFLDKRRVLAGGGDTIRKVAEHMDEIKALNPSYVYLCYGLNDVSIGIWSTPEEYAAEMMEVVDNLNTEVPNATVVISSILPAKDPAFNRSTKWLEIPQYSAAVEAACKEKGVIFVNNDKTASEHMDLWEVDGIHLTPPFYPYWGSNLIIGVLEAEQNETTDS